MGVIVSPSLTRDRSSVILLWQEAGLTRGWNNPEEDYDRAMRGPASTVLVARDEGQVVGSVMVGYDGHRGWVYYLPVAASHRGRGVGRSLMKTAEVWLKALGCPKAQLMMRTDNPDAAGFYTALGYEAQQVVTIGRRLD